MEGMFLHGAAHIFFENKLAETESQFNTKFKKFEQMFREEIKGMFKLHVNEIKKLKTEVKLLKLEVSDIRKSEDDLSVKGMDKIRKLTTEVKTEVNEIKKIKSELNQLKKDVSGIQQSEEDLSNVGRDSFHKLSEEFKDEVKKMKADIKVVKKDIVLVKEIKDAKKEKELKEDQEILSFENIEKNDFAAPLAMHENLSSIEESSSSADEDKDIQNEYSSEKEKGSNEENLTENVLKENTNYIKYEHPVYKNEHGKTLNDDHLRRLVFASSSCDSSDNPEGDDASADENKKEVHFQERS